MLHALDGFVDAGSSASLALAHLLENLEHREVAVFDTDVLVDYRSRRPRMTFEQDRFTGIDMPRLVVRELVDTAGTPFLVLSGPEPDVAWERFAAAVRIVVERLGVRMAVGLHGIPWPAPHTRPVGLTPHASDRSLIAGRPRWVGTSTCRVTRRRCWSCGSARPGSTRSASPPTCRTTCRPARSRRRRPRCSAPSASSRGCELPVDALHTAGMEVLAQVDTQVSDDEETRTAIQGLERQYDAVAAGRSLEGPGLLGPTLPADEMADGDALAADLERYLRDMDGGTQP